MLRRIELEVWRLGDLYISHATLQPFRREDGTSVHLATTEARFMPD